MQQIKSVEDMYATAKILSDEMRNRGMPHWCFESLADITQFSKKKIEILKERELAVKYSIVDTVGGIVEGRPTNTMNYLQRLRELVNIEHRCLTYVGADKPREV